jgi:hypothetical protein
VAETESSVSNICINLVDALFECLETRLYMMPVTIRIMLKLRLGLMRFPNDKAKIFTEMSELNQAKS